VYEEERGSVQSQSKPTMLCGKAFCAWMNRIRPHVRNRSHMKEKRSQDNPHMPPWKKSWEDPPKRTRNPGVQNQETSKRLQLATPAAKQSFCKWHANVHSMMKFEVRMGCLLVAGLSTPIMHISKQGVCSRHAAPAQHPRTKCALEGLRITLARGAGVYMTNVDGEWGGVRVKKGWERNLHER
jgi:hypothetical protein